MKPINVINKLNESFTVETKDGNIIETTSPVEQEYGINKNADYVSGLNVGDTVGLRWISTRNSNKSATIKDITNDYIELDIWDDPSESLRKAQMFSTKNIEICSREIRFSSFDCVEGKDYSTLMFVEIEERMNEDNFSIDDKIDSIEIYGEDYQFSDILEELGYEYCLKLYDDMTGNNNLLIYKEVSGNEDFFVIDTTSTGGTLYKVDHNGERLFLSENEAEVLSKRFNRD